MTKKLLAGASALSIIALLAAAAPAQAATFATYTASTSNFDFTNNGNGTGTLSGSTLITTFVFQANAGTPYNAKLVWTGTTDGNATALALNPVTKSATSAKEKITGTFQFIYEGATGTFGGISYVHDSTLLLGGSFTDAVLQISGTTPGSGQGSFSCSSCGSNYTSSVVSLANATGEGFILTLANDSTAAGITNHVLKSFVGQSSGQINATVPTIVPPPPPPLNPSPSVPEPASWAMMLVGFGLVGGVARRRKALVAA